MTGKCRDYVFSNYPKSLPKNLPDCPILYNWAFDNLFISWWSICASFTKPRNFVLVNDNLWGKLISSLELPITFDEIFTSVPFVIPDFKLLRCDLHNVTFNVSYWVIFTLMLHH